MRIRWFRTFYSLLLLVGLGVARPAGSNGQERSPVAPQSPLNQLAWFVGGTWTGEEKSVDGSKLTIKLNCRWADTKTAILFKVSFKSGGQTTPQYEGMYLWHPGRNKLTLWQVNSKGEVAEGEITVDGDAMDQLVRVSHPDGGVHFLKAHYQRLSSDAFRFKAFFRLSETAEWQDAIDLVYKRQPDGAH